MFRSLLFACAWFMILSGPFSTEAQEWPGWRGDGSGVAEGEVPDTWDTEHNVVWKTEIPGHGLSSPVISQEKIFLTTAEQGSTRRWISWFVLGIFWLCGFLALWWHAGRAFRPLRALADLDREAHSQVPLARRILFSAQLLIGTFLVFAFLRWAGERSPTVAALGSAGGQRRGLTWDPHPDLKIVWLCGITSLIVVFLSSYQASPRATRSSFSLELQNFLIAAATAALLSTVLLYGPHLIDPTTDYSTLAKVGCLGLISTFGSLPRSSGCRLLGPCIALLYAGVTILSDLRIFSDWRAPYHQTLSQFFLSRLIAWRFLAFTVAGWLACAWFALQALAARRHGNPFRRSRYGLYFGPAVTMVLLVLHVVAKLLVPETGLGRSVLCLHREDGRILWKKQVASRDVVMHEANSAATPTPVTDGRHVFAHFGDAGTFALDGNGRLIWANTEPVPTKSYGAASSPVLWRDLLILTQDSDHHSATIALDKATGRIRWRANREPGSSQQDSYGTPLVLDSPPAPRLIHASTEMVAGYDPATGRELWQLRHPATQMIASPVAWRDLVIVSGGGHNPVFMAALSALKGSARQEPEVAWRLAKKSHPGTSSPVVYGDHVYMVTDHGRASCLEAETGRIVWQTRLPASLYYSSPVAAGGKIFFSNTDGDTIVIAAGPELRILAVNALGESIGASPAIAGSRIFLRTRRRLYCIGGSGAGRSRERWRG